MKHIIAITVILSIAGFASPVFADIRATGYAVGAFGGWSGSGSGALFGGAGGAEGVINSIVGVGGEGGLFTSDRGGFLASISPGVSIRIPAGSTVVPFVTGGYSYLRFAEQADHAYHLGGGVEFAKNARRGLRVEFRDFVRPRSFTTYHYWAVRVGVSFRD